MNEQDAVQLVRVVKDEGVDLREYVDRIFAEKKETADAQRVTLEKRVDEAKDSTEKAMNEAKATVEARLVEAKNAADGVTSAITKRLDLLESGGAPFASRLDSSLTELKTDVDALNVNMVKTTVLDALREQTSTQILDQKRSIRNLFITVGVAVLIAIGNIVYSALQMNPSPSHSTVLCSATYHPTPCP